MRKIVSVLMVLMSGCSLDSVDYTKASGPVPVTDISAPDTGTVGSPINFSVRLTADNGCWSNLKATLTQTDSKHFRVDGKGIFESNNGTCASGIISKDTALTIKPGIKGWVYIQGNLDPFPIIKDSIAIQ